MLELIETMLTTTSLFNVIRWLSELTVTEMMVIFLLSKPLFVLIGLGAMFSGYCRGDAHYLHVTDAGRMFSESGSPSDG